MYRVLRFQLALATGAMVAGGEALAQPAPRQQEPTSTWMLAAALTGASLHYADVGSSQGALGAELSVNYFPSLRSYFGVGAFVDALGSWSTPASFYGAAGVEVWHSFGGLELGASYSTAADGYGATGGLFVGPFVTLGLAFATVRLTLPVYDDPNAVARGFEANVLFGFKVPFFSSNDRMPNDESLNPFRGMRINTRQGRALRVAGSVVEARARAESVGEAWFLDALEEHASVAAFARVALELMALGAPMELVAACHLAALDELRHTGQMLALAAQCGVRRRAPELTDAMAPMRVPDVAALATESLMDGCYGEAAAAALLREGARGAADPWVKEALEAVAEDESRHAKLAWELIAWCLAREPERVCDALMAAVAELSRAEARGADVGDGSVGRASAEAAREVTRRARDEVIARAWALDGMTERIKGRRRGAPSPTGRARSPM